MKIIELFIYILKYDIVDIFITNRNVESLDLRFKNNQNNFRCVQVISATFSFSIYISLGV